MTIRLATLWTTALTALLTISAARPAAAVTIPDKGLDAAIRGLLPDKKDPAVELTEEDLKKVFILQAKDKGIVDLTGLELCTNLQLLDLAKNQVTNVAPLAGLENLQSLDLSKNAISDMAPLAGLAKLQYLDLSHNQIAALPNLDALVKISFLDLSGNQLTDIAAIGNLKSLVSLHLAANQIADATPVGNLTGLSLLKLSDNPIENIAPLGNLNRIGMLLIERAKIADLAPLVASCQADAAGEKRFAPFLRLYLAGNPLSDAAKNEQLPALTACGVKVNN
jgi:internalin A